MVANDEQVPPQLQGLTSRMDPVPPAVLRLAKESLAWRDVDVLLAELVSETRSGELAGVRGAEQPELLTFTAGDLTIEVELTVQGDVVALLGQLVPPQPARLRVDHGSGPTWLQADTLGRFAAADLHRGHLRVTCYPQQGVPVNTEWTLI